MPEQTANIIWGVAGFVLGAFIGSFLSEFGKDTYNSIKFRLKFKLKSEHEVEPDFRSKVYAAQNCTWIPEGNLKNKESHHWKFHPHPKYGGKCFRMVGSGKFPKKEYLMVTPNANKL